MLGLERRMFDFKEYVIEFNFGTILWGIGGILIVLLIVAYVRSESRNSN